MYQQYNEKLEQDGRVAAQKSPASGDKVWIVERDECGEPYEIGGYMFLAFAGQTAIVSTFVDGCRTLDETMEYHIEETMRSFYTCVSVFPKKDCYLTREEAYAALKGEYDHWTD